MPVGPAEFRPAWWLRGGHAQTVWGALLRPTPRPTLHRQRLELPDGDFLDLDWSRHADDETRPLVLVLHGLAGSSRSGYVGGLVAALERHGLCAVVMNFRGCGGEPNRLPRTYHAGEFGDPLMLLHWLRRHWPQRSLAAAGFSLGGNVLLRLLQQPGPSPLSAAAVACVPMQLEICARRMERGFSRVYLRALLRQLRKGLVRKHARTPLAGVDLAALHACRGFREFDELVTAPLHGFTGADHYYTESSSRDVIGRIGVPTLIVHAGDDPFMTDEVLPSPCSVPPSVRIEHASSGGHMGFIEGRGPLGLRPRTWLEGRLAAFLAASLSPRPPPSC